MKSVVGCFLGLGLYKFCFPTAKYSFSSCVFSCISVSINSDFFHFNLFQKMKPFFPPPFPLTRVEVEFVMRAKKFRVLSSSQFKYFPTIHFLLHEWESIYTFC